MNVYRTDFAASDDSKTLTGSKDSSKASSKGISKARRAKTSMSWQVVKKVVKLVVKLSVKLGARRLQCLDKSVYQDSLKALLYYIFSDILW
jgi:hypothetical protein